MGDVAVEAKLEGTHHNHHRRTRLQCQKKGGKFKSKILETNTMNQNSGCGQIMCLFYSEREGIT